jgi:hypothetical protein
MGLLDPNNIPELGVIMGLLGGRDPQWAIRMQQMAMQKQLQDREAQELKMRQESHGAGMQANQMRMEEMRKQQALQEQMRGAASQAFAPPSEAQGPMPSGQGAPMLPGGGGMPDFQQRMMQIDPLEGMKYLPKPREPKFHNVNGNLVEEPTQPGGQARPVFTAPREPKDWENPDYQKFMMDKARAGASRVNVDTRQESEFAKAMGKNYAENYQGILNSGFQAQSKMNSLNRFQNIVSKIPTGKLEPVKSEVAKLAASFGMKVDMEKLSYQEALDSLGNEFALTLRNPSGGAGMPGALSDKDREFLVSMVPGLGKTPGGNMMIIEAAKRVAQREAEVAQLARAYKAKTGRFDEGFYEVLAQEFGGKDILGDLHAKVAGMPQTGQVLRFDRNGNPL